MQVDLLAFGPHPDDLEIGLGGTLAKHAALGHAVGLCDLTRGEMASNGTPEERLVEAEAARAVLGAAWRENLGLPDRAIGSRADHVRSAVGADPAARPRASPFPYWQDRHPDHAAASRVLTRGGVQRGIAPVRRGGRAVAARVGLLLLHQRRRRRRRSSSTSRRTTRRSARALACYAQPVHAPATGRGRDASDLTDASSSSSKAATRSSARWPASRLPKGIVVTRAGRCDRTCSRTSVPRPPQTVNIGIVCYASVGGSGIVATELAKCAGAARPPGAHHQHASRRSGSASYEPGLAFHRVAHADLSAVPRAAVPAVARQQDRAAARASSRSTSSTRTTPFRTRPRPTSRGRSSRRRRRTPRCRRSSPRCTAPTSRCSAAIRRTRRRSRSRSSSPTA